MEIGDYVELTEEATYARGGLRKFDEEGEIMRMQVEVVGFEGQLIRVRRRGAVRMKFGSYPMVELIGRGDVVGVVEPGLAVIKKSRYEREFRAGSEPVSV